MTTTFTDTGDDPHAVDYWRNLESALMAQTLAATSDLPPERRKALMRLWLMGTFDAAAAGLDKPFSGCGLLEWRAEDATCQLVYHAPYGLQCSLGQAYRQADGSWAALVVAGVRDDPHAAMAAIEWAVSRLTAE